MRRIAVGLLGIAILFGAFALRHITRTSPEHRDWAHHADRSFGWSVTYPPGFHLRQIDEQSRVTENGFLVSNVPLADAPRVRTSSLPPTAVAFRLVHRAGGPAPRPVGRDTQLPLSDILFLPRHEQGGHRTFGVVGNGFAFGGDVWIGPEASRADRLTLTKIVGSLRFPRPLRAVFGP